MAYTGQTRREGMTTFAFGVLYAIRYTVALSIKIWRTKNLFCVLLFETLLQLIQ